MKYQKFTTAQDLREDILESVKVNEEYVRQALALIDRTFLKKVRYSDVRVSWQVVNASVSGYNASSRENLFQILRENGGYEIERYSDPEDSGFVIKQVHLETSSKDKK